VRLMKPLSLLLLMVPEKVGLDKFSANCAVPTEEP
jgi:hypothetical protein